MPSKATCLLETMWPYASWRTALSCRLRDRLLGYVLEYGHKLQERDVESLGIYPHRELLEEDLWGEKEEEEEEEEEEAIAAVDLDDEMEYSDYD